MTATGLDWVGRLVLGRYRIVGPLAEGGMGVVYLGRVEGAAGFAKPVVVKTVIPHLRQDSAMTGMFVREARILSNLHHPAIVGVIDFGEMSGSHVMVLEYVHGFHLGQWLRYLSYCDREMDLDHALLIATHVLDALHYAHQLKRPDGTSLGIVHRDVSPANILIDAYGRVKLHDFGVARMTDDSSEYKTEIGTFKGTYLFAAPETFQGQPATAQSDLYSCALVLYQMLAGANPLKGRHSEETLYRVLNEVPPLLSTRRPGVPEAVDLAVARALSKDPAGRFATAGTFADALRAGRLHTEEEAAEDFARVIAHDFQGDMPASLGIESLLVRDQAWRAVQEGPPTSHHPLNSTPPIPAPARLEDAAATVALGRARVAAATTARSPEPASRKSHLGLLIGLGVTAVALASSAAWVASRSSPTAPMPSFIVIEKQRVMESPTALPPTGASVLVLAAEAPTRSSDAQTKAVPAAVAVAGASRSPSTSFPGAFSRAFQQQQPAVEQCFARFATDVEGRPTIMVRFTIDDNGAVQRADLMPSALNGTEFGTCLLKAARATRFAPQAESVTFTIPVTARRTR